MSDLKLVFSQELKDYSFRIGNIDVKKDFLIIGGPCAIESKEQIIEIAKQIKKSGGNILRGGAFKPRQSPYSFAGLGEKGLQYLKNAGMTVGLPTVTEVLDTRDIGKVDQYCDILQIGARNIQNYALLKEVGKLDKPILLKRGMNSTIEEWLYSAEYILKEGNKKVILCERGIKTLETYTRNTLDLSAVCLLKKITNLPVITDISHATGRKDLIEDLSLASIMAGSDGLMLEVHDHPENALCDGKQSLKPEEYKKIIEKVKCTKKFYNHVHNIGLDIA